jgi:hypothetical protein
MRDIVSSTGSTTLGDELASIRRAELAAALRHDLTSYNGPTISFGIMLAGGAYPLIIAALFLAWFLGFVVVNLAQTSLGPDAMELAVLPFFVAGYAVLAAVIGWMWFGLLAMITLPVVYGVVRSLKLHGSLVTLGATSGGLVGFIAVLPLTLCLPWINGPGDVWVFIVGLPLGPGLATVLGQAGGAWGGLRASQNLVYFYGIVATSNSLQSDEVADALRAESNHLAAGECKRHRQFGLRHMMWLIVWFSVLLSVIRLSGISFSYAIPLLAGWIVYQWITLRIGMRLIQRFGPWWIARRACGFHVKQPAR